MVPSRGRSVGEGCEGMAGGGLSSGGVPASGKTRVPVVVMGAAVSVAPMAVTVAPVAGPVGVM